VNAPTATLATPRRATALAILCLALLAGCAAPPAGVYQNSTIDALLDGNYDGEVTFAQLRRHGDFGLGTFDAADGEMVALDGRFFQVRSDFSVREVPAHTRTPFSAVTFFRPTAARDVSGPIDYHALHATLDAMRPADGHAYAFRIDGRFVQVKVRSVPRQSRPYPPLADVARRQSVATLTNVGGTLVGFWFPASMRHLNVPGYHFHFLTRDRTAGGHVLDLTLNEGRAAVQPLETITVALPRTPPTTRPTDRRAAELDQVER
jgi:acetolactate decarboxylase